MGGVIRAGDHHRLHGSPFGGHLRDGGGAANFVAQVLFLGFVTGYLMIKTDSIWGSVLFHAGADLIVPVPVIEPMS